MQRRSFLKSLAAGAGACVARPKISEAALPKAKITKVNIYDPPNPNRLFNQSNMVVTVETDAGITGIGEGGARDTLEQCAGTLIARIRSVSKPSGRKPTSRGSIRRAAKRLMP